MADYITRRAKDNEGAWLRNHLNGVHPPEYTTRAAIAAGWVKAGEQ